MSRTVLIVDDEPVVREVLQRYLEAAGYETALAEDGEVALAKIQAQTRPFDVILLDLVMPKLGGKAVLRTLQEWNYSARCVILTGLLDPEEEKELQRLGARAFLHKPCTLSDLLAAINPSS
ncbi:MAG TPA: response regulator [Armatimonadetes bacterium]|nr:response regulator [Armatimonadota bacterium]